MAKKQINNRRIKIVIPILIVVFTLIVISAVLFVCYMFSGNYINYGLKDSSYENATTADATSGNLILINNVVLGAANGSQWVPASRIYDAYNSKTGVEVDVYNTSKMYGTYKTASFRKYDNSVVYTTLQRESTPESYLAITSKEQTRMMAGMTRMEPTDEDKDYVKEALGAYKLINGSIKISEVYVTNINQATDRIICVVAEKANILGVYSAVIYVTENKATLVKYSYVKDTDNASRWPVYALKFVMNLNEDSKPEIILEETTGTDVTYSILEMKNNEFYEVLRTTVKL